MPLLFFLVLACASRTPPELFPEPTGTAPPPLLEPLPSSPDDDAPAAASLIPGQPAPYVQDGLATHRGHVLPTYKAQACYRAAEELTPYWRGLARTCYDGRRRDEEYAQGRLETLWYESEAYRLRSMALPWAVAGGAILGLAGGVLTTLGVLEAVCSETGCAEFGDFR